MGTKKTFDTVNKRSLPGFHFADSRGMDRHGHMRAKTRIACCPARF